MKSISNRVRLLGYGGVIPFFLLTAGVVFGGQMMAFWAAWALTGYGVAILSFIGAIHWGVALTREGLTESLRNRALLWGVAPSLLAVLCLMLPHGFALLGLATLGVVVLLADIYFEKQIPMPQGWIALRVHLTLGVCASLAIAGIFLPSPY